MAASILIFRIGQLGDTVVALPAIWAVRQYFRDAQCTLLCDWHPSKSYILGADLLSNSGLVDAFESYPVGGKSWSRPFEMGALLRRLRAKKYDVLVYLAPSSRTEKQVHRDRVFFKAAGIKQFIGMDGFSKHPSQTRSFPLARQRHEADELLARLALSGIPVPPYGQGCMNLNLSPAEELQVQTWQNTLPPDGGRVWLGFGPGSKMPAKRWALERYAAVGTELIQKYDIWPVVFGGPEDVQAGNQLLQTWGRGYNAAGQLSLRAAVGALQRCSLYIGNDTGTMHLAAAAGIKCVAVFSSRDWPGKWDPYGFGHKVLRTDLECSGCMLHQCLDRKNECLTRIQPRSVVAACEQILSGVQDLNKVA